MKGRSLVTPPEGRGKEAEGVPAARELRTSPRAEQVSRLKAAVAVPSWANGPPYPFLLMSMSPRNGREVCTLQHVPSASHNERSHISVRRRVIPTGTATADSRVPERWWRQFGRKEEGTAAVSLPGLSPPLQNRCKPRPARDLWVLGKSNRCHRKRCLCLDAWSIGRDSVKVSNPVRGSERTRSWQLSTES